MANFDWIAAHSYLLRFLVSILAALLANALVEGLPRMVKIPIQSRMKAILWGTADGHKDEAVRLAVHAVDFVSASGAILVLSAAIATELWKLSERNGQIICLVLMFSIIAIAPAAVVFSRMKWMEMSEDEYAKHYGARLKWIIRGLSILLVCLSVAGGLLETPEKCDPPTAKRTGLSGPTYSAERPPIGIGQATQSPAKK